MDVGLRGKLLEKIMEFLSKLPDAALEGEGDKVEMGEDMGKPMMPEKGKLEMMAIEAKPKLDEADKLKGC